MIASGDTATLLSRVEDAGLNASAPPQQRWVDGWLVRYSPGKAQRARCINAVSVGRLSLDERLALCQALYAEHGLPMLVRMTPFSQPEGLDHALAQRGFVVHDDTRVMVCAAIDLPAAEALPQGLEFADVSLEAYAHIVGEFRGTLIEAVQAHAQRLLSSPVSYRGWVVRAPDGTPLACAQFAIEGDFVGLYDVFTALPTRAQGLARKLCAHLLRQAVLLGARVAYLQVDSANHAARSVYNKLGFTDVYGYHYRAAVSPPVG